MEMMDVLLRLENSVVTVSEQLGTLARVVEKNDSDRKEEIKDLWNALKEQGKETSSLLREQSQTFAAVQGKGEITVGKIIGFCTFLGFIAVTAVATNNAYMGKWLEGISAQFKDIQTHRVYAEREREDIRADLDKLRDVDRQQELAASYDKGRNEVRFQWLRDDAEAIKEDLQHHIESTVQP